MLDRLEQIWRGIRWVILEDRSTLGDSDKPSGIRRRAMIFSLAASVLIWLLLSLSENDYLPVEYVTCASEWNEESPSCIAELDEDSALVQPLPEIIRATLYGPRLSLLVQHLRSRYWSSPITFSSDAGVLETQMVLRIPEEVSVETVVPERIYFQKEARIERRIPIESRVMFISEAPHLFAGDYRLDPDTVLVSGPASVVGQIASWPTEADSIFGTSDTVQYQVHLEDSLGGIVRLATKQTTVSRLAPRYTEGQKERVKVEVEGITNTSNAVQLDPEYVTVTYQVPLAKFSEARQSPQIRVYVSYAQIYNDTTGNVVPAVDYPSELMLRQVTVSPGRLRYFINIGSQ